MLFVKVIFPCYDNSVNLIENKKVRLNYEILETFTAGVELLGIEVKSIRNHQGSFEGSHITIRGNEAFLLGATIPPYQPNNTEKGYLEQRHRKLLLKKEEIEELQKVEKQRGLTIVPISMYNKGRTIKLDIAIVRGKKKFDKRADIKKRDTARDVARELLDR